MADIEKIADQLSELTVMEAADLSKLLEEKWGVSAAAAPVAVAASPAALLMVAMPRVSKVNFRLFWLPRVTRKSTSSRKFGQ